MIHQVIAMGNESSCSSESGYCGADAYCYTQGMIDGSSMSAQESDFIDSGITGGMCSSESASKAYGEGYAFTAGDPLGTGVSAGDESQQVNRTYPNGHDLSNTGQGQGSVSTHSARKTSGYVGGHEYYELRDGVIVFTRKYSSFLEDSDFRNFDHYRPWNVTINTARVNNQDVHTPLTLELFGGHAQKYAYGSYDSGKTKELKKSYNTLVDKLYDNTNRFSSMASDMVMPTKIKLANMVNAIEKSNYKDYKQECERRRALGIPQDN